jgi:putative pre-16S rRNA nuclease
MSSRVLGLDLGSRRIGLAISDVAGSIAFPAGHLVRTSLAQDLAALRSLARERGVACIVVGLPLHMDGRSGEAAQAARRFAAALAEATALPVELLDERWTTREAERALRDAPRGTRARRAQVVDSLAATLILRTYLEARQSRAAHAGDT